MRTTLLCLAALATIVAACSGNKTDNAKETEATTEATQTDGSRGKTRADAIDDFTLYTPDGSPLSAMSEVSKNKITIIDFWASWCQPCMREMPSMKSLYADYHTKGLGIVGVSLDEDRDQWQRAIKELALQWPQMSDLRGWESKAARMFDVNAIPFVIVVDSEGVVLKTGLRGDELRQFVSQQLQ